MQSRCFVQDIIGASMLNHFHYRQYTWKRSLKILKGILILCLLYYTDFMAIVSIVFMQKL